MWSKDQFTAYTFVTGHCIFQSATFKLGVMMREKYGSALGKKKYHILMRLHKWCGTMKAKILEFSLVAIFNTSSGRLKKESRYVTQGGMPGILTRKMIKVSGIEGLKKIISGHQQRDCPPSVFCPKFINIGECQLVSLPCE